MVVDINTTASRFLEVSLNMSLAEQQWSPTSVQVTVLQARGLRIKGKSGTNDAYAVMQVGKEKYQTSVVEKTVAPVWKEEATFDLLPQQGSGGGLHVHVLHRALVGPDKLLGQAVINLLLLSEDKTRNKTEWFKLLDKTGKQDKDRGEVLVDIQFLRNNMTASMFDLSAAGKSRSRLGKFKDKVRGKKKDTSDSSSNVVPSFTQVLTDSEEEGHGGGEASTGKDEKKKKLKMKSLFSPKSNLQKNMSQSMSVLPAKNSSLSGSLSSGLNVDSSEGKKKFKFKIHIRTGSSDTKDSSHQKHAAADQSNVCINGSHVYCEEPQPRTSRIGSNYSLASSGHGSMDDVPDSSPPSVDSLRAARQYSPWTEEEEEEEEATAGKHTQDEEDELRKKEEEKRRKEEEELERLAEEKRRREKEEEERRIEDERRRRKEEEEFERLAEEKKREEERRRDEEERIRRAEEDRVKREEEEEELKRLAEVKNRQEEEEMRRIEEERVKREEEERRMWEEEERKRQEEEEEERKRLEEAEQERKRLEEAEEERKRQEEEEEDERKRQEEEERKRLKEAEEERERQEEEERVRREEELERLAEEKRKQEELEKQKVEEEERKKREEEEIIRLEREREERRRQQEEEERARRLEEEEEEARREEEEKIRREEERVAEERRRQEEEEKRWLEEQEQEQRRREEEERIKKEEEEEKARKEKEEYERLEREKRKQEEEERKRIEAEERQRREEEDRIRLEEELKRELEEEEKKKRMEEEEAERIRQEEEERIRKGKEEYERMMEEKMRQEELERRRVQEEEEQARKEEQERVEKERRRKEEEEERARKEMERLAEEKRRQEEKQREEEERVRKEREEMERLKRRQEEEAKIKREEEERIREEKEEKEEEARRLEKEAEEQMKRENEAAGRKVDLEIPAEAASTNPFDEDYSCNTFEEIHSSPAEPDRCQSTTSTSDKDLISSQRGKRAAPLPPGRTQAERQTPREKDGSALRHMATNNEQNKDKDAKAGSLIPKRSVKKIPPVKGFAENTQSSILKSTTKVTTSVAKPGKRLAPQKPGSVEAELKPAQAPKKQEPVVYGLNPFEEDEDEAEHATKDETARKSDSVQWPPPAEKDTASQTKVKSSKMAPAPPLPVVKTDTLSSSANQSTKGGLVTGDTDRTTRENDETEDSESQTVRSVRVKGASQQESQHATVQGAAEEACGKKEAPPPAPRRLQPVKPLNPSEQSSAPAVQKENKSAGIICEVPEKTTVNDTGIKGPYSQLTKQELISMVLKQENKLTERDRKISELEQYIDNLLVRVIEEAPTILMSMNSVKKPV